MLLSFCSSGDQVTTEEAEVQIETTTTIGIPAKSTYDSENRDLLIEIIENEPNILVVFDEVKYFFDKDKTPLHANKESINFLSS